MMHCASFSSLSCSFTIGIQRAVCAKQVVGSNLNLALHMISNNTESFRHSSYLCNARVMAASGSKASSADFMADNSLISSCGTVSRFASPNCVHFGDRGSTNCWKTNMSLQMREVNTSPAVRGHFIFDISQRSSKSGLAFRKELKRYCTSSSPPHSDGSSPDEHLASLAVPIEQNMKAVGHGSLKLVSGSCYLPHPDKVKTGGEDAHFISEDEMAIGVADGVGGWADVGINAGEYARELMSYSVKALLDEPKGSIDPARVLEKAYSNTNAQGSSTACIIALTSEGLHAINLGDSGFVVVRGGHTIFESPVQQHGFNFPYQLQSGSGADLPSSGQVFTVAVKTGDVIVVGTDGLFDNLYKDEIAALVRDAVNSGFKAEATAKKIADIARQRALDSKRQTPFADAAQEVGFQYYGGKLDDLTVVVSFVTDSTAA
ncbi:unnamed protein product [Cuscuta campestris]|uniref:Protein phosphatase n=1 Tax=Cuscuta campestris TaxID=132261 RepID=A0A484M9Z1_9ASTE|nr:unnamed protein product [Cuscuta campestris]